MYNKIKIENFRGIPNLELNDPRQFNLFVGKTNCGKTSLLESIFLLCVATNARLPVSINNFRRAFIIFGFKSVIFHFKFRFPNW